ncbi:hypothetical protein DL96DRAFT_1667062 [Flagelloscypha sp. PMI_526]|nr:hypothetical protein DL96DRAFT_1667062 [Flagelloscypha sp. PMI_526]
MKLPSLSVLLFLPCISVSAQYFSKGWTPGQPVEPTTTVETPAAIPTGSSASSSPKETGSSFSLWDLMDPINIVKAKPVASVFQRFGVNVTERIEQAEKDKDYWDPRIPILRDDNYQSFFEEEEFSSPEELKERVWAIVVSVPDATGKQTVSRFVDEHFDAAFDDITKNGQLPHVKWARIDYFNVTYLTTKWNMWRAPAIVILQDRGLTLRFYQANQIRLRDNAFRDFMLQEVWKMHAPWISSFAPGGEREWIMHNFALFMKLVYDQSSKLPKWVLMIISGAVGSLLLGFLHKSPSATATPSPQPLPQKATVAAGSGSTKKPAALHGDSGKTPVKKKGKK